MLGSLKMTMNLSSPTCMQSVGGYSQLNCSAFTKEIIMKLKKIRPKEIIYLISKDIVNFHYLC